MSLPKSLVQHDFRAAESFGGTIASLPSSALSFDQVGGGVYRRQWEFVNRSELPNLEVILLRGKSKERWRELCERVVSEQDPERFEATLQELLEVLEERETKAAPRDKVRVPPIGKLINKPYQHQFSSTLS